MSIGGIVGAVVGGVVGFIIGGPAGAAIGMGLGTAAGMAIDPLTPDIGAPGQPEISETVINQAKEGAVVIDILGTTKVSSANYLWYGRERVEEVKTKTKSGGKGGGGKSSTQVTGYNYFLSWALGICKGPIDSIYGIFANEHSVWWGKVDREESSVTLPLEKEMKSVHFFFGTSDQLPDPVMTSELSPEVNPAYQRFCYCVFYDSKLGGYNRAPSMKFILRKTPVFSFNSNSEIGFDYNPAHAIWYILTQMVNLPESYLDPVSFSAVADTLFEEQLGVSINFNVQKPALEYLETLLFHIDGILYWGNDSKFHLKLLRDDIPVSELPEISESEILNDLQIDRPAWVDTKNEIKVQYVKGDTKETWEMYKELQDYTTYSFYDPRHAVTVESPTKMSFDTHDGAHAFRYYKDFGEGFFAGNFEHRFQVRITSETAPHGSYIDLWGLSNTSGFTKPYLYLRLQWWGYNDEGAKLKLTLRARDSLGTYEDVLDGCPEGVTLYFTVVRDVSKDALNRFFCNVYRDPARTNLIGTMRTELNEIYDFQWCFPLFETWVQASSKWLEGYIENLELSGGLTSEVADFKEAEVNVRDIANQELVGKINHQTVKLGMFTNTKNAAWRADRLLKTLAYPLATVSFSANRDVFRLEPGDAFKLNYEPYSISGMVCRLTSLTEENIESESIQVTAIEDIDYLSSGLSFVPDEGKAEPRVEDLKALSKLKVFEAPYVLSGSKLVLGTLAGREVGTETGYEVHLSIDGGSSFFFLGNTSVYSPFAVLENDYPETYQIDDQVGFDVTFSEKSNVSMIETGSRIELFGDSRIALLGDEIISFQTITPISENTYRIENIFRGRFDTKVETHSTGENFWFLDSSFFGQFESSDLVIGENRKFKFVPFSASRIGDISESQMLSFTPSGRALTPYQPSCLQANGRGIRPKYSTDIVLEWRARIRGPGWANFESNSPPSWEGLFKIEVYVSGELKRSVSEIDAVTWTYSQEMNVTDNGSLADSVEFRLFNYIDSEGRECVSAASILIVRKE